MVAWKSHNGKVAVLGGARTPFAKAGTALRSTHVTDLARVVIQETLYRTGWSASLLDEVILGNVVMPADAANPARVAAIQAGVGTHVPAMTVQRNCGSGMEAVAQGAERILTGHAQCIMAGGAESMSTVPLLFPTETLGPMAKLIKAKSLLQRLAVLLTFRPRHFRPIAGIELGLTDPLCNMIMGKTAEVLAHEFGISRKEQDEFALRSHLKATAAIADGRFDDQIASVYTGNDFKPAATDIGPRDNQTMEALGKLRPIFDRRDGTVTVGNACQITDGAAAMLLADTKMAKSQGAEVVGYVRAYATAGLDPTRMGLGPVYAIDRLLQLTGLSMVDIDLFEINEAFAAQVLACCRAMASDDFCRKHLGRSRALGYLDGDRLNVNGGAIALGHPVGATGTRIILDLLMQMKRREAHLGIASLCVAGGQGAAILLERK